MKAVFVGGGSFRTLPIVRAAMAYPKVFDGGEIQLVDLNVARAETVGRMIMKTPEYAGTNCRIEWGDSLDRALPGADLVSISMPVGSQAVCMLSDQASMRHGFTSSDQLSVSGAFRSLTGGTVVLDVARRMEKHCPEAWLIDFANPVAVYSGMVNNHTKIKALGICGGFGNHRWDLTRLMGRDEYCDEYDVDVAGINHLSFILRGTYRGEDLYKVLGRYLKEGWKPPQIQSCKRMEKHIRHGLRKLAEMYHRFGRIIYSTEGDGMTHLFYEEMFNRAKKGFRPASKASILRGVREARVARAKADAEFASHLDKDLNTAFWKAVSPDSFFGSNYRDISVPILKAIAGISREKFAASHPNFGAVVGFKDRTVLEYSMVLDKREVTPVAGLEVPDCFHGLISSLATHQTLLGDAIATRDPKILADALFCYPIHQNTMQARALFRELLRIHKAEIPAAFQKAKDYL